jgi:DNA-binding SARP family transcriptional activator/WD40 repeat protein
VGVKVLGPAQIEGAAALATRDRRVLAALVVSDGRVCPAERLADALYGDAPPSTWRKVVQGSIVRLRKLLGAAAIDTSAAGYRLTLAVDEIDARSFEQQVDHAEELMAVGDAERAASALGNALTVFRDEPFVDLEDWEPARAEAARLSELRLVAQERLLDALLASGQHRDAASLAASLVEAQPLREQRWVALALAQYRGGRQGEALQSLQRARHVLADELGLDPGPEIVALERSILDQDIALAAPDAPPIAADRCPYHGLAGYDVDNAEEFFGRERAVHDCLRRLSATGAVVIVGPSGCGKSSLARAGVAATLRRRGARIAVVRPGADPGSCLDHIDAGSAIVVDQLEELFTLSHEPSARVRFVSELVAHAAVAPVVLTLRSDHLGSVAELPDLAEFVERSIYLLRPMAEDDLRSAIEGPATYAGLRLEPGLVDLLVRDVVDQPGALPLLSHAMTELWTHRDGRVLTTAAYRSIGGVQGAVGQTAERAIESLSPDGRRIARELFLRLVSSTDGEPVRHRVALDEVTADVHHAEVLDTLAQARLLTVDDSDVQLAHEALARAWPRLRAWLDEDRDSQRILLHLSASAGGWLALGRADEELYRGARLQATEEWIAATAPTLTPTERTFVDASIDRRRREEDDIAARVVAQARANRRLRSALGAVAVVLIIALFATGFAAIQRSHAATARRAALADAHQAQLHELVSEAAALQGTQRDLGALLALAAYRLAPSAETYSGLLSVFTAAGGLDRTIQLPVASAIGVLLPDGHTYAAADPKWGVHLLDLRSGRELGALPAVQATTDSQGEMAATRDGRAIAMVTGAPNPPHLLTVWDLTTHRRRFPDVVLPFSPGAVAFSPDGRLVAVSGGPQGDAQIRRADNGALVSVIAGPPRPADAHFHTNTAALAFLGSSTLVIATQNGPLRVVDPRSGLIVRTIAGPEETASALMAADPNGRTVYGSAWNGLSRFDVATGRLAWVQRDGANCDAIAFAVFINALLCSRNGRILVFDASTGVLRGEGFDYQQGLATTLALTDQGRELVEAGAGVITTWRLDGGGAISRLLPNSAGLLTRAYLSNTALLAAHHSQNGPPTAPRIVDPITGRVVDRLAGMTMPTNEVSSGRVGARFDDGTIGFYDIVHHRRVPGIAVRLPFAATAISTAGDELLAYSDSRLQGIDTQGRLVSPSTSRPANSGDIGGTADGRVLLSNENGNFVTRDHNGKLTGSAPITNVAGIAQAGNSVLVGTGDGLLRAFDPRTMHVRSVLPSPGGVIIWIGVARDGNRFVGVVADGNIRVGDIAAHAFLGEPIGDTTDDQIDGAAFDVTTVPAFSPNGEELAYATNGGIVEWNLDPQHLIAAACHVAGRDLSASEWQHYVGTTAPRARLCA